MQASSFRGGLCVQAAGGESEVSSRGANDVDRGEELWEHGSVGHAKSVFEELVLVPLILGGPGLGASRIDQLAQTLDILPTIAARLGLEARPHRQGRSLVDRAVMDQDGSPGGFQPQSKQSQDHRADQWAVHQGNFKFVDHVRGGGAVFIRSYYRSGGDEGRWPGGDGARMKALLEAHRASNRSHALYSEGGNEARVDFESEGLVGALGYLE